LQSKASAERVFVWRGQLWSVFLLKLAAQLLSVPQQEDAGADAASRFHYQALYGLALIFEAHKTRKDYAVVFEYHDDIAFLDSSVDPTKVSYFQVKTKGKGHWTLGDIVRQAPSAKNSIPAKKLPSFIGKMYRNVLIFGDFLKHLSLTRRCTSVRSCHRSLWPSAPRMKSRR
jgi:hypothetical protein